MRIRKGKGMEIKMMGGCVPQEYYTPWKMGEATLAAGAKVGGPVPVYAKIKIKIAKKHI